MDTTILLHGLPANKETYTYLLFEAGAQSLEAFRAFYSGHAPVMSSLYIHPQLETFREYGPWLLEAENQTQLSGYLGTLPGVVGVIAARRHLSSVAIQLSRGCTIVGPDNHVSLVRFYAQHVLEVLSSCAESDWHRFLFRDIEQWWVPGKEEWEQVIIPVSTASNPPDPIVRLDNKRWPLIVDKIDISSVLTQWQKMPSSLHFSPCIQRDMVIKALEKAKNAGITNESDSKLYALCYLNGGKRVLESEEMQLALLKVSEGKCSLESVLLKR